MKLHWPSKAERGTSIVEVVVAIAILGIMAGGIIGSFSYGFYVMQLTRENQRATQIMLEKVEAIRLFNWDQLMAGDIPTRFTDHYNPQGPAGAQGPTYHGTIIITNFAATTASYSTNLRQLNLTVEWTNSLGRMKRTRSLSTLIARNGFQNYVY